MNGEKFDIVCIYVECRKNASAKCLYSERFSNRTQPSVCTFRNFSKKLKEKGSFKPTKHVQNKPVNSDINKIAILAPNCT